MSMSKRKKTNLKKSGAYFKGEKTVSFAGLWCQLQKNMICVAFTKLYIKINLGYLRGSYKAITELNAM